MREDQALSRSEVRTVRCPACQAPPGRKCIGARGQSREANHRERAKLAASRLAMRRYERSGFDDAA
jgi:hypothetical protein